MISAIMEADMQKIATVVGSLALPPAPQGGRMVNKIVPTTDENGLPELYVPAVDRDIQRAVMWWENGGVGSGTPVLRRPFSADEQSILERRVWELRCALAPFQEGNRNTLICEIAGMFAAFPAMQRYDEATALGIAAGYLWTVRDRPHWAIVKACTMVRAGTAGLNRSYAPSEPEFATLVARLVEPYVQAHDRARRLIEAKVDVPPPKLTQAEIEAKLGRPLGSRASSDAQAPPVPAGDGKHAERALGSLAAQKARREAGSAAPQAADGVEV
jgi:hypothetical protein